MNKPQPLQDGFIRFSLALPFLEYLDQARIDTGPALSALGLSRADLTKPDLFVHAELVYELTNELARLANDPYLGVHVGDFHDLAVWPPFAAALDGAGNLADFLIRFVSEVPSEANSVRHEIRVGHAMAVYSVRRLHNPIADTGQINGFAAAHYVRLLETAAKNSWNPNLVTLSTDTPAAIPPGFAGVTVKQLSQPGVDVNFPTVWLWQPFSSVLSPKEPKRIMKETVSVVSALRSLLTTRGDFSDVSKASLSRALGLSEAKLAAALKRSGTTLSREVKRLKIDLAKSWLEGGDLSAAEIGRRLGYADAAHFNRFFKSQTAETPGTFRKSAAATARKK